MRSSINRNATIDYRSRDESYDSILKKKIKAETILQQLQNRIKCMKLYESNISAKLEERAEKLSRIVKAQEQSIIVYSSAGKEQLHQKNAQYRQPKLHTNTKPTPLAENKKEKHIIHGRQL